MIRRGILRTASSTTVIAAALTIAAVAPVRPGDPWGLPSIAPDGLRVSTGIPRAPHQAVPLGHLHIAPITPAMALSTPVATLLHTATPRFTFMDEQLQFTRVRDAQTQKDSTLRAAFAAKGLTFPSRDIFLRAFKRDRVLELWARDAVDKPYTLVKQYSICTLGGSGLGPKQRAGDEQVPEGIYSIASFNPSSQYFLSLGISYPNQADRIRNGGEDQLGGSIMIHGGCKTIGCMPITDDAMKELYIAVAEARAVGQAMIPVHIFPTRMDDASVAQLHSLFAKSPKLVSFWDNLKESYDFFEKSHQLPRVNVDPSGKYRIGA
jgi:murein L,D-transpeptidase YafK